MAEGKAAETRSPVRPYPCFAYHGLTVRSHRCRDHGRKLKHAGDAIARTPQSSRKDILRALAHHIDSILLYVYSFWCDDSANRNCNVQQWESGFGLISFVRKMAEKENVPLVVGLWCVRVHQDFTFDPID